ncbi:MAG: Fic family protein [Candidatus Altiarchaeota archaeon]|nr:Fic family protein [Candidatus Altiarchaeota archaeon]
MDKIIHERLARKKRDLDSLRPLPRDVLEKLRGQFAIELAYNSNAIEGNTLTLKETQMVIEEGITIKGKPLREHFEAINHQKAFEFVEGVACKKTGITGETIRRIHKIIVSGIEKEHAGKYRRVNVRILGAIKSPPRFEKVQGRMKEYVEYVNSNPEKLDPVELAAMIHYRLVEIHPFTDGNGRTSRLLMNLFLMRHGYPVSMVLKVDRKKYYDCLKKADKGDVKPFIDFIARNVERSLDLYLDTFRRGSGYITLAKAAERSPYSQEYLSLLARKGRIDAIKIGRNWHVKKGAIEEYVKTKKK